MSAEFHLATQPSTKDRFNDRPQVLALYEALNHLYSTDFNFRPEHIVGRNKMFDSGGYGYKKGSDVDFKEILERHIALADSNDIVIPHDRSYHRIGRENNPRFLQENLELLEIWDSYDFNLMYALHARNRGEMIRQLKVVNDLDIDAVAIASSEVVVGNGNDRNWTSQHVRESLIEMSHNLNSLSEEYNIETIHFFGVGGTNTMGIPIMMGCNSVDASTPEIRAKSGKIYIDHKFKIKNDLNKYGYYIGSPRGKNKELLKKKKINDVQELLDAGIVDHVDSKLGLSFYNMISDNIPGDKDPAYAYRVIFNTYSTSRILEYWEDAVLDNDDVALRKEIKQTASSNYQKILLEIVDYMSQIRGKGPYDWYNRSIDKRGLEVYFS